MKVKGIHILLALIVLGVLGYLYSGNIATTKAQILTAAPWQIDYSKWRILYKVDLSGYSSDQLSEGVYIKLQIPHEIIDDMVPYLESVNSSLELPMTAFYTMFPRVYKYNIDAQQQTIIPYNKDGEPAPLNNPAAWYTSTYKTVPDEILINYPNGLDPGIYYFIVYLPRYFYEDWEPYKHGQYGVGSYIGDWKVVARNDVVGAGITVYGRYGKVLYAESNNLYHWKYIFVRNDKLHVPINSSAPLKLQYTIGCMSGSCAWEIFVFLKKKDNTMYILKYYAGTDFGNFGLAVNCKVPFSSGANQVRDIIEDLKISCGLSEQELQELDYVSGIGVALAGKHRNTNGKPFADMVTIISPDANEQ